MNDSPRPTLTLLTGGKDQNGSASSPYGPLRAGLVTYRTTHDPVLSELLNDLERRVRILQYRSCTALNISPIDTVHLAAPGKRGVGTVDGTDPAC
jgi:hypothetical protein